MTTSDSPVPYTVAPTGVTLPAGQTFPAHGHINIKITTADGTYIRSVNMHFDPNNNQPGGAYIGQSFFPVSLAEGECIGWVQIHGYNEHFGEGGQSPVCVVVVPPVKEPIVCPPGKVPGWLDEHGDAQGCVDNNPNPNVKPPIEEILIPTNDPVPPARVETGSGDAIAAAVLLIALGGAFVLAAVESLKFWFKKRRENVDH